MARRKSEIVAVATIVTCCLAAVATADVVCDKFDIKAKLSGDTIKVSLDTDLPDNTEISVGVSRVYFEKGEPDAYSVDYFSDKSTVGKWKKPHDISIASDKWKASFRSKQIQFGFKVASISDKVEITIIVPIDQSNPEFGRGNSKLTGKAVRSNKIIRFVEKSVEIHFPLDTKFASKQKALPSLDPLSLDVGATYIVSKETPLMPTHSPSGVQEVTKAIRQMKVIPKGGSFKVLEVYKKKSRPWYKVNVSEKANKKSLAVGWINSLALVGQQLKSSDLAAPEKKPDKPDDIERRAAGVLRLAKGLLSENRLLGNKWLRKVIKRYPNTEAAQDAKKLLR